MWDAVLVSSQRHRAVPRASWNEALTLALPFFLWPLCDWENVGQKIPFHSFHLITHCNPSQQQSNNNPALLKRLECPKTLLNRGQSKGTIAVIITYSFHSKKYCFNPIQDKILSEKKGLSCIKYIWFWSFCNTYRSKYLTLFRTVAIPVQWRRLIVVIFLRWLLTILTTEMQCVWKWGCVVRWKYTS